MPDFTPIEVNVRLTSAKPVLERTAVEGKLIEYLCVTCEILMAPFEDDVVKLKVFGPNLEKWEPLLHSQAKLRIVGYITQDEDEELYRYGMIGYILHVHIDSIYVPQELPEPLIPLIEIPK